MSGSSPSLQLTPEGDGNAGRPTPVDNREARARVREGRHVVAAAGARLAGLAANDPQDGNSDQEESPAASASLSFRQLPQLPSARYGLASGSQPASQREGTPAAVSMGAGASLRRSLDALLSSRQQPLRGATPPAAQQTASEAAAEALMGLGADLVAADGAAGYGGGAPPPRSVARSEVAPASAAGTGGTTLRAAGAAAAGAVEDPGTAHGAAASGGAPSSWRRPLLRGSYGPALRLREPQSPALTAATEYQTAQDLDSDGGRFADEGGSDVGRDEYWAGAEGFGSEPYQGYEGFGGFRPRSRSGSLAGFRRGVDGAGNPGGEEGTARAGGVRGGRGTFFSFLNPLAGSPYSPGLGARGAPPPSIRPAVAFASYAGGQGAAGGTPPMGGAGFAPVRNASGMDQGVGQDRRAADATPLPAFLADMGEEDFGGDSDSEEVPSLWALAQVDYIAGLVERDRGSKTGKGGSVKALHLLQRLPGSPDDVRRDLPGLPPPTADDPAVWSPESLRTQASECATMLGREPGVLLWKELYAWLRPRDPAPPPRAAVPPAPAPAASAAVSTPLPPAPAPPPQPAAPATPPAPAAPRTAVSASSPIPLLTAPTPAPAGSDDPARLPRQPGCVVVQPPADWGLNTKALPSVKQYSGDAKALPQFEEDARAWNRAVLGHSGGVRRAQADMQFVVRSAIDAFFPPATRLRTTYVDAKIGKLVDAHYAAFIAAGGEHNAYHGQGAGAVPDLFEYWLRDVRALVAPNSAIAEEEFKAYRYPVRVQPTEAAQRFREAFSTLPRNLYPTTRLAIHFFEAARMALQGGDVLGRYKENMMTEPASAEDVVAAGAGEGPQTKWTTLTLERAEDMLNNMVTVCGVRGLEPAAAAAATGGGSGGGGGSGSNGGRSKATVVPIQAAAVTTAGNGASTPPQARGGVTLEVAQQADKVFPAGKWVQHQGKTCRYHAWLEHLHTQAQCRTLASRLPKEAAECYRICCDSMVRRATTKNNMPQDLAAELPEARNYLASLQGVGQAQARRPPVPTMAVQVPPAEPPTDIQLQLARLEGQHHQLQQQVLGQQQQLQQQQLWLTSAASDAGAPAVAPVQAVHAWRQGAAAAPHPPPSVAGSVAPSQAAPAPPPRTPSHWQPAAAQPAAAPDAPLGSSLSLPFGTYATLPCNAGVTNMPLGFQQHPAPSHRAPELRRVLEVRPPLAAGDPAAVQEVPRPLRVLQDALLVALAQSHHLQDIAPVTAVSSAPVPPTPVQQSSVAAAVAPATADDVRKAVEPLPYLQQTTAAAGLLVEAELLPNVLVDSGSGPILVAERVALRRGLSIQPAPTVSITTAAGRSTLCGLVRGGLQMVFAAGTPEAHVERVPAFVVADAGAEAYDLLLGMRSLKPLQAALDFKDEDEHLLLRPPGRDPLKLPVVVRYPALASHVTGTVSELPGAVPVGASCLGGAAQQLVPVCSGVLWEGAALEPHAVAAAGGGSAGGGLGRSTQQGEHLPQIPSCAVGGWQGWAWQPMSAGASPGAPGVWRDGAALEPRAAAAARGGSSGGGLGRFPQPCTRAPRSQRGRRGGSQRGNVARKKAAARESVGRRGAALEPRAAAASGGGGGLGRSPRQGCPPGLRVPRVSPVQSKAQVAASLGGAGWVGEPLPAGGGGHRA